MHGFLGVRVCLWGRGFEVVGGEDRGGRAAEGVGVGNGWMGEDGEGREGKEGEKKEGVEGRGALQVIVGMLPEEGCDECRGVVTMKVRVEAECACGECVAREEMEV